MDKAQVRILALYAGGLKKNRTGLTKQRKRGPRYMVNGEICKGQCPADLKGSFVGNTGSIRRSRKGRSVVQPNGFRQYQPKWWLDDGTAQAYKV